MGEQSQWHFCQECSVMFFSGKDIAAGVCVNPFPENGGRHIAEGFEFTLPFEDDPEGPNIQANWFFCRKCSGLFFVPVGGDAGTCAKDMGPHDATGSLNFHLPHNIPEAPSTQKGWRFCFKCSLLYFGGNPGHCVKGGGHEHTQHTFNFVLAHGDEFIPKHSTL